MSLRTTDKRTWEILLIVRVRWGANQYAQKKSAELHIQVNNLCWFAKIADVQLLGFYFCL